MKLKANFWNKMVAVGIGFAMLSCGSEPQTETPADTQEMMETTEEGGDEEINFVMPSPLQIAAIFKRAGLEYSAGNTNAPDQVSKYESHFSKAINFGVYAADLSYCVLNKQSQAAIQYMNVVKKLSDDLGMTSIFGTDDIFSSFERNLDNEDSLIYILATIQENLDEHLDDNEQQYMSVVFFAGGWIEGMYIGSKVAQEGKPSLTARLIEQMVILENMIAALENYPHEAENLKEIIADFKAIDNEYRNFESLKGQDMEDVSFADLRISKEELASVVSKIQNLRNKIVNG